MYYKSHCSDKISVGVVVRSDKIGLWVEIVTSGISVTDMLVKLNLVPEEATDATESLDKLEALLRLVSDKLNLDTEATVVIAEPLSERVLLDNIVVLACLLILEILGILLLCRVEKNSLGVTLDWVLENISVYFEVLKEHHSLKCSDFHCLHGVLNTEHN